MANVVKEFIEAREATEELARQVGEWLKEQGSLDPNDIGYEHVEIMNEVAYRFRKLLEYIR